MAGAVFFLHVVRERRAYNASGFLLLGWRDRHTHTHIYQSASTDVIFLDGIMAPGNEVMESVAVHRDYHRKRRRYYLIDIYVRISVIIII